MRTRLALLTILVSILAACVASRSRPEKAVTPIVTGLPAFPDTAFEALRDAMTNLQRALDDTAFASLYRALQDTATFAALFRELEAQQPVLLRRLQESEEQRKLFEQLERIQRSLDEMIWRKPM